MNYAFSIFLVIAFLLLIIVIRENPKSIREFVDIILNLIFIFFLLLGFYFVILDDDYEDLTRLAKFIFPSSLTQQASYIQDIEPKSSVQSNWDSGFYVDEFGDLTNDAFVKNTVKGEFSNFVAENESLRVEMFINNGDVFNEVPRFRIFTYSETSPQKEPFFNISMACRIKNQNNIISDIDIRLDVGESYFYINSDEKIKTEFRQLIVDEGKASFACKTDRFGGETYRFKFDFKGYNELYKQLNP